MNDSVDYQYLLVRGRWLLPVFSLTTGLVILIGSATIWWSNVINAKPRGIDFLALYAGGQLLWQDRTHLYDLEQQWAIETSILAPYTLSEGVLPYNYPPFFTLLLVPLAWLPFELAYVAVTGLNLLCLGVTLRLLVRRMSLDANQTGWLLLITFCAMAVYVTLVQGQTSMLALLLLVLCVLDLQHGKEIQVGIWIGLLSFKPQLLPLFLLVLAWQRCWRGLLAVGAVLTALILTSLSLVGIEGLRQHLLLTQQMAVADGTLGIHPLAMHNLRALARFSLPPSWASVGWWGSNALVVLATLWMHQPSLSGEHSFAWRWSATIVALLLVSPHLYIHDLVLVILPCALILSIYDDNIPALIITALVGLGVLPLLTIITWYVTGVNWPVMPVALIFLFLFCLRQCRRGVE